jgi:hypothetical protein
MEAVNSRLLILPFCMDAIVHKHAATLRQLPGNIFDVAQSGSLGHDRSPSRILRKTHYFILAPTTITPIASTRFRNASFDLKDRLGMFHTNMEKFGDIHDQLVSKIAALAATPASAEGEAIPLRIDIPPTASIELWDSSLLVSAHAGNTLTSLAASYHVPLWAILI